MPNSDLGDRRRAKDKPRRVKRVVVPNPDQRAQPKVQKPRVTKAPVTDVQSSSRTGDYGAAKAAPVEKRERLRRVRASHRSERASERPDADAVVKAFKQSDAYVNAYQDARAASVKRTRGGITDGFKMRSAREALRAADADKIIRRTKAGVDEPRRDDEVRSFLESGKRVRRTSGGGLQEKANADMAASSLKILNETTRPIHAVAGATDAALKGQNVPKAALRGLQNKNKVLFSDVLKTAGAPNAVQSIGGFGLDVLADPTTYVTFGAGTVLRKGAIKGAEGSTLKGATVKFAGKQVPGVTRASGHVARGVAKVAHKAAEKPVGRQLARVGAGGKDVARDFRPTLTPAGADKAAFEAGRQVARKARATANGSAAVAERHARGLRGRLDAIHKQHGTSDAQVAHALDTNDLTGIPQAAHAQVREVAQRFAELKKIREKAGIREGTVRSGYFPHAREDALHAKLGIVNDDTVSVARSGTKRTGPAIDSAKVRRDVRPIRDQNPERVAAGKAKFSTDVPLVYANYAKDTGRLAAENHALRDLAATGKVYHEGDTLKAGQSVFHLGYEANRLGLRPYKEGAKLEKGDKLVVLDTKTVDTVLARIKPARAETATGRAIDKVTGGFKGIAVATPGFHIRNAIGDTQMAYLSQPGHKIPGNTRKALKVNKAAVANVKAERQSLTKLAPDTGGKITIAGAKMDVSEVLRLAEQNGVVDSGKVSRELRDLVEGGGGTSSVVRASVRHPLKSASNTRAMQYVGRKTVGRENVTRLSTFIHGLDQGLSPAKAADLSLSTHIDYGELTDLERKVMRRAMPFYTFSARALPLHVTKLVTNPGKFANYEKVREELGKAFGVGPDSDQSEFQQRGAGIAVGKDKLISFGLPLTLLNEVPTSANPLDYAKEVGNFAAGLTNPVFKDPVELLNNYSFFYRDKIRRPEGPLVAAPEWAKLLPDSVKRELRYTDSYVDKKSGDRVPGWDSYANYVVKAVPGPVNLANQLASKGKNQQGRGAPEKIIGGLLGIKVDAISPEGAALVRLYAERDKVTTRQSALRQQGIGAGDKAYDALSKQSKALGEQITSMSVKRGDVIPAGVSRVRRKKKSDGAWGGSSGGSSGGSDPWGGSSSSKSSSDPWG